jgi:hypothetical protein
MVTQLDGFPNMLMHRSTALVGAAVFHKHWLYFQSTEKVSDHPIPDRLFKPFVMNVDGLRFF